MIYSRARRFLVNDVNGEGSIGTFLTGVVNWAVVIDASTTLQHGSC